MIFAIDAGVRKCGIALFDEKGILKGAYTVHNPDRLNRNVWAWRSMVDAVYSSIVAADLIVIETMQNDGRVITDALDVQATHDAYDAIGIGLYHLNKSKIKRLNRK